MEPRERRPEIEGRDACKDSVGRDFGMVSRLGC